MANGYLYQNPQVHTIQNTWIDIMESDRARRLKIQDEWRAKQDEYRKNILSGFADLDVEGDFLNTATNVVNDAGRAQVELYKKLSNGEINETEYLLNKQKIDNIPLKINAAYQIYNQKMNVLGKGDEVMNRRSIDDLTLAGAGVELKYDDKSGDILVGYNTVDEDGKTIKSVESLDKFSKTVNAIPSFDQLEDPSVMARQISTAFKSDLEQRGRTVKQGLMVGTSAERFDKLFTGSFGDVTSKSNPYVMKEAELTDVSYEEAWKNLYDEAKAPIAETSKVLPEPQQRAAGKTPQDKMLEKFSTYNPNRIKDSKDPSGYKRNISVEGEDVSGGYAVKITPPEGKSKIEIPFGSFDDFGSSDLGSTEPLRVSEYYFTPDGEIYVKGTTPSRSILQSSMKEAGATTDETMKAISKMNNKTGWQKLNAAQSADVKSKLSIPEDVNPYDLVKGDSNEIDTEKDPLGLGI